MASPAQPAPQARQGSSGGRLQAVGAAVATVAILGAVVAAVAGLMSWRETPGVAVLPTATPTSGVDPAAFLVSDPRPAPAIQLVDATSTPFSLTSLRGHAVFVFFGYTHCPDVCPATIGTIGEVLAAAGPGTRALFVSIDPERDTPAWLKEYSAFLPAGLTPLTGTAADIRITAQAWGVRYARVNTDSPDAYSMSHTASVFLVDPAGTLRAVFPFGTPAQPMIEVVGMLTPSTSLRPSGSVPATPGTPTPGAPTPAATPGAPTPATTPSAVPSATATAAATPSPGVGAMRPEVVSTSVWAEPQTPVILTLNDASGRIDDPALSVTATLVGPDGAADGPPVPAVAVHPAGENRLYYVATLNVRGAGQWRLDVAASGGGRSLVGSTDLTALAPGGTPTIGSAAPTVHTPTLADVGGVARAITTDPQPDLRLSTTSTTDALAAHKTFVLVVDSPRFRVSPACGKAVIMARYLADRWPGVAFIHLEPYQYSLISDTAVLTGDITDPHLNAVASAWGFGDAPWGAISMPWLFVVDQAGVVRAKYQGLMGSDDVDVLLSLLAGE